MVVGLEFVVTNHVPKVLLAEICGSRFNPAYLGSVIGFGTFLGHSRLPAFVDLETAKNPFGEFLLDARSRNRLRSEVASMPAMDHAKGNAAPVVIADAVKRPSTAVADQWTGQRVNPLPTGRWAGLSWSISLNSHFLTTEPQLFDFLWDFVGSGEYLFIGPSTVVDDFALVKTVV